MKQHLSSNNNESERTLTSKIKTKARKNKLYYMANVNKNKKREEEDDQQIAEEDPFYHQKTIAHLEAIAAGCIDSINARNFDQHDLTSIWAQHFAKNFRASPDFPIHHANSKQKASIGMTLDEYLRMTERLITNSRPGHRQEVVDMSTHLDVEVGKAQVFMNTKADSFVHEGVRVDHVAVLSFVWEERRGRWLCVRFTGLRGFFFGEGV